MFCYLSRDKPLKSDLIDQAIQTRMMIEVLNALSP